MNSNVVSRFDVWVQRVSHLSQLGLLVLAAFGYIYTVRPIYTKSLLEEEIAKKQIEMKEKDQKIAESNRLIGLKQLELKKTSDQANLASHQLTFAKNSLDKASQELAVIQRQLYDRNNDLYTAKVDLNKSKLASDKYYYQLKSNVVKHVLWRNSNCAQEPMDFYNIKFSYNKLGRCINDISSKAEILNELEPKDKKRFLMLISGIDETTGSKIDQIQSEYDSFYKTYKNKEKEKYSKLSSWTLSEEEKRNIIRSSIDEHFNMNNKLSERYHGIIQDAFKEIERQFLEN
ncbi:hypothetical protein GMLC_08030 [Geomonas limicola]|uniref:Uncharacterized protein n=1 Tax=Geomonas limicola TaxID=2740186 RepID=A0A6V8N5K9_9BACT|nr:hypothetical protein [Geomonas limicola]GFO67224.1 hypothetical protein GMLC_08030 [Geomonas limicola]